MPIIKPEIQAAMRNAQKLMAAAGVEGAHAPATEEESAKDILSRVGLSLQESLEELAIIAKGSQNEGLRSRAVETALKIHGALKESAAAGPTAPSFTIVINDSKTTASVSSSDLNFPEGFPEGVNPIFVPRQLLSSLRSQSAPASVPASQLKSISEDKTTN